VSGAGSGTVAHLGIHEEGYHVIARIWRGRTRTDDAESYERHYRTEVLGELRRLPGFGGARLLRREVADETEFMSVVFFDDIAAIRRFAGDDLQTAVVAESARRVLVSFDAHVQHYDVAVDD
jgi:heme-degrading monooxygenase HmoA